jgi:hypothetical protein
MDLFGEITDMLQAYFECGNNTQAAICLLSVITKDRIVDYS